MLTDFRLKVFVCVAREMSFTRSAQKLKITQPAVTKHIKELEKQLGVPLFLRQGNRIVMTQHGTKLLTHAESILSAYAHAQQAFEQVGTTFKGQLQMGASTTISQYLLPQILARFNNLYPQIEVHLKNGNSEEIESDVINGTIDFGMVEGNRTNPSLHYEHFLKDEIILVTATANRSLRSSSITVDELLHLPLLIREAGSGTLSVVERKLRERKIHLSKMNITMELGSSESIKNYLLYSECVAFISRAAVEDYIRDGKLRVVKIDDFTIERSFRFIALHGNSNRSAVLFKEFAIRSGGDL